MKHRNVSNYNYYLTLIRMYMIFQKLVQLGKLKTLRG